MSVDIQFNADQAIAKLGELVARHGPQAVELAAEVVRMNAVGHLAYSAGWLIVSVVGTILSVRYWRWLMGPTGDDEAGFGAFVLSLAVGAAWIVTLVRLLNVWTWVALFNPKLALAHEVIAKFAGS